MARRLSLKVCALQWLAQREHSRVELRRKLMKRALADAAAVSASASASACASASADADADVDADADANDASGAAVAERVDALLDWLEAHRHLSQERFVESRVHARSARFGNLRIRQELQQHQLALGPEAARALRDSELQRACAVRERKFGAPPAGAAERARQARFLAGRGFSPEVIARVLRDAAAAHLGDEPDSR